jgi:hypothetical protein
MMRNLVAVALTLALIVTLVGCSGDSTVTEEAGSQLSLRITDPSSATPTIGESQPLLITALAGSLNGISLITFEVSGPGLLGVHALPERTSSPASVMWDTSGLLPGVYQVVVTAYDNSLPVESVSEVLSVTIAPDPIEVTLSITHPEADSVYDRGDTVNVSCSASAVTGIDRVEMLVNGVLMGSDDTYPYVFNWPTIDKEFGIYLITLGAYDQSDPALCSFASVPVIVQNPVQENPSVLIIAPGDGAEVAGVINVHFRAEVQSLPATIAQVTVKLGTLPPQYVVGSGTVLEDTVAINTALLSDGVHALTVTALDTNGHVGSADISLTVNNGEGPPPNPF